jgi:TolB protein
MRSVLVAIALSLSAFGCGSNESVTEPRPNVPNQPPTPPAAAQAEIAFVSTRDGVPSIYLASADGEIIRRLTRGEKPAWSPGGWMIAFHRTANGMAGSPSDLYVINVDGTGERRIATAGANPSWSPNGKRIVFNGATGESAAPLFTVLPNGTDRRLLVAADFDEPGVPSSLLNPTWSPDGTQIAFVRANSHKPRLIVVVNADYGTSPNEISTFGSSDEPAWSPNGRKIAFGGFGASPNVVIMNTDGTERRTFNTPFAFDPDWSPDGTQVIYNAFSSSRGDEISPAGSRMRIYVANVATGSLRLLIGDAVSPAKANYWDDQAAWWRGDSAGSWDY